jgi:DNA-binding transcriptional LysR family regulator
VGAPSRNTQKRRRASTKTITPTKPPLDLNLLRVLLALDRTRYITRAAELLNMRQSGFSSALARLRNYSNDQLFVRTAVGKVLRPYSRRMTEAATAALATIEDGILAQPDFDPANAHGEFSFAMTDLAKIVFLPRLLNHMQRIAPNFNVHSQSLTEEQVQQALSNAKVDLALGYFPAPAGDLFFEQAPAEFTGGDFNCEAALRKTRRLLRAAMSWQRGKLFGLWAPLLLSRRATALLV